jgi:sigma-B regulation protein RsbU (phosphoserine phosphatase)
MPTTTENQRGATGAVQYSNRVRRRKSLPRWSDLPRPLLLTLATLFAGAAILYGSLWMYNVRRSPLVELGFDNQYNAGANAEDVLSVIPGSPAERAGLRANDRIVAVNGRSLDPTAPLEETWMRARPGDPVDLIVERPGEHKPLLLRGLFRAASLSPSQEGVVRNSALGIIRLFPVVFLVVGLTVLFLRLDDPKAWLLALMFCSILSVPHVPTYGLHPALRAFSAAYRSLFHGLQAPLFYLFFAVFPARSPIDRRLPWLKWAGLALGAWIGLLGIRIGDPRLPGFVVHLLGQRYSVLFMQAFEYSFEALGLASLIANAFEASTPDAVRKIRIILWGAIAGVLPITIEGAVKDIAGFHTSFWLEVSCVIILFLFPLSFAYAVVKHRVLEIPALLKRSARYILVRRGFVFLILVLAATVNAIFSLSFTKFFHVDPHVAMAVGVGFGIFLASVASPAVRHSTQRIDRAFFRGAYDARRILQDLAEKMRTTTSRHELAALLENHLHQALHPTTLAGYMENQNGHLVAECGSVPPGLERLPATLPVLVELTERGRAWEVTTSDLNDSEKLARLKPLHPDCLVPILDRSCRLIGLLVLGPRLSEEPYSGEDKQLLDSVASQLGIALESIRLAEDMARRMEAEHRAAHEMEIARQVQARLFPQKMPPLRTLEYAGSCVQARQVGGDYYDFLDLGPGRLGIVLADISGKGISGALLMANLQANLRSQYAMALEDVAGLLTSVNRLFYQNSSDSTYATLFFADYDDSHRRLRYVNCGHLPLLLLHAGECSEQRADKQVVVEKLHSTSTVLGLFENWKCEIAEVQLCPGDILVLYTDGITEAANIEGEEFGESRLLDTVKAHRDLPVEPLMQKIITANQQFSSGEQQDDLTLVVARHTLSQAA